MLCDRRPCVAKASADTKALREGGFNNKLNPGEKNIRRLNYKYNAVAESFF